MFTTNLEKALISRKTKELSNEQELIVKEAEKILSLNSEQEIAILEKIGLTQNLKTNESIKKQMAHLAKYDRTRVFKTSEIKDLCTSYGLRFLPSSMFKGTIDTMLPIKIMEYEAQHGIIRKNEKYEAPYTYIAAPASSFKLEERPKDPLFFHRLDDDHYYLIHKWGGDISVWNYIKSIPNKNGIRYVLTIFLSTFIISMLFMPFAIKPEASLGVFPLLGISALIGVACSLIFGLAPWVETNDTNWNSEFEN